MKKEIAQAAIAFLDRVNLSGKEVEAFQTVKNEIIRSIDGFTEHKVDAVVEDSNDSEG